MPNTATSSLRWAVELVASYPTRGQRTRPVGISMVKNARGPTPRTMRLAKYAGIRRRFASIRGFGNESSPTTSTSSDECVTERRTTEESSSWMLPPF
jgi:hypothetical protein